MKEKKEREWKKEFRGKGKGKKKKGKKKSSVGFKPFRLFLLLSCLCNGRGGWKDWFHFSSFLGHTLHCFVGVVPGRQSGR